MSFFIALPVRHSPTATSPLLPQALLYLCSGRRSNTCPSVRSWERSSSLPALSSQVQHVPLCNPSTEHLCSPDRLPDIAASSVDTWKSRKASSTSASVAKGCSLIFAKDSAMRTMASSCLQPQETLPAFSCSYKGVPPDSCNPHLHHSRHLLPPPHSTFNVQGHTLAPQQCDSPWISPAVQP